MAISVKCDEVCDRIEIMTKESTCGLQENNNQAYACEEN